MSKGKISRKCLLALKITLSATGVVGHKAPDGFTVENLSYNKYVLSPPQLIIKYS